MFKAVSYETCLKVAETIINEVEDLGTKPNYVKNTTEVKGE